MLVDATQKFALQHASPLTWRAHAQAQQPEVAAACPSPSIALMTCIGQCVMRVMMQSTAMCTIACTTRAISQSPENRAAAGTWCHRTGRMCLGVTTDPPQGGRCTALGNAPDVSASLNSPVHGQSRHSV